MLQEVHARAGDTEQYCLVRASVYLHDGKTAEAEAHLKVSLIVNVWVLVIVDEFHLTKACSAYMGDMTNCNVAQRDVRA